MGLFTRLVETTRPRQRAQSAQSQKQSMTAEQIIELAEQAIHRSYEQSIPCRCVYDLQQARLMGYCPKHTRLGEFFG